jgi:uncharacterized protein YbjQ (UPF0145 family)
MSKRKSAAQDRRGDGVEAKKFGANAVIGVTSTTSHPRGMLMVAASGTAVKIG